RGAPGISRTCEGTVQGEPSTGAACDTADSERGKRRAVHFGTSASYEDGDQSRDQAGNAAGRARSGCTGVHRTCRRRVRDPGCRASRERRSGRHRQAPLGQGLSRLPRRARQGRTDGVSSTRRQIQGSQRSRYRGGAPAEGRAVQALDRQVGAVPRAGLLMAALSGVLLALSFPKYGHPALAFVALVPLLVSLRGASPRQGFLRGLLAGFIHYAGTVYWTGATVSTFGGLPVIVAVLVAALLALYMAAYIAVFGAITAICYRRFHIAGLWLAPAVWV